MSFTAAHFNGWPMSPLEPLAPDQRAVVALVLQQGRSYDEIAALLGIPAEAVRARAHAGLTTLVPGNGLPGEITGPLTDYLLGQQTDRDAEATRGLLADSGPAREWATGVAGRLTGVAAGRMPEIPDAAPAAPGPRPRPLREPGPAPADAPPASSRLGGVLLIVGVLAVVAVVLYLVLSGGDDPGRTGRRDGHSGPERDADAGSCRRSPTRSRSGRPAPATPRGR